MEQILFDSTSMEAMVDGVWENFEWDMFGGKPESKDDPQVWNLAEEYMRENFEEFYFALMDNVDFEEMVLYGTVEMFSGKAFGYKVIEKNRLFDAPDYDNLTISYEDGDIHIYEYHHDGTNEMVLRGLLSEETLADLYGDTKEYEDLITFRDRLRRGIPLTKDEVDNLLPEVTSTIAYDMEDYLSDEAIEDLSNP